MILHKIMMEIRIIMKKTSMVFLILLLLTVFGSMAMAEIKNARLTMLGCTS
jgi:hypothetical protein